MIETPFFFANGRVQLFAVLHEPYGATPKSAFVLCHPFGEEKLWSHRVFVDFARRAARLNSSVLRFDFMGHGDSDGRSEDCTLETYLSDIEAAVQTLRGRLRPDVPISVVGLRFGATLASLFAETSNEVKNLVLWQPIIAGARYMQELLRINLTTQLSAYGKISRDRKQLVDNLYAGENVNVDGYLISGIFHKQCHEVNLLSAACGSSTAKCLIVQIAPTAEERTDNDMVDLANRYNTSKLAKLNAPYFWREIRPFCQKLPSLADTTFQWTLDHTDE